MSDINKVTSLKEKKQKNKYNIIVMSAGEYANKAFDKETIESLLKSEEDINSGRTKKATEVIEELKKHGQ